MATFRATSAAQDFIGDNAFDFVDYSDATFNPLSEITGVTVSLSSGGVIPTGTFAVGDTFTNIDGLIGSAFNDLLDGNTSDNELRGGAGDDLLFGDDGADTLDGGSGTDMVFYHENFTTDYAIVDLQDQSRNAHAAAGDVLLNVEGVSGTRFDDIISGDAGNNTLAGREGNDTLDGRSGYDTAFFSGPSSAFNWVRNSDGSWTVTDTRSGGEGTDILQGIEALSFTDRAYGLPNSMEADDIFRFYNTKTKVHFYTNSEAERDFVIANYKSFKYEGNAFDTTATADTGVGVYRFYNTKTKTHFYTSNATERDYIQGHYKNFKYEGVAYYAYSDDANGAHIPLYRFYNTKTNTHFYTADANEQQYVAEHYSSFKYEGIAFYVDLA
jgi:hypothetical protein